MENQKKKVLTVKEASAYTGYAISYIYKLTSQGVLPYCKPNGKTIFFDIEKLEEWLLSNEVKGTVDRCKLVEQYKSSHNTLKP